MVGLPGEVGAKDGAVWLRGLVALTAQAAGLRADLAEELTVPDMEPTRAAFAAGDIGVAHAGVVARTMHAYPTLSELMRTAFGQAAG